MSNWEVVPLIEINIDNSGCRLCITSDGKLYFREEDGRLIKVAGMKTYGDSNQFATLVLRKEAQDGR